VGSAPAIGHLIIYFNAAGAFVDQLLRTEKGWRIKHRTLVLYFVDPRLVADRLNRLPCPAISSDGDGFPFRRPVATGAEPCAPFESDTECCVRQITNAFRYMYKWFL
jgi:hypothetical protein